MLQISESVQDMTSRTRNTHLYILFTRYKITEMQREISSSTPLNFHKGCCGNYFNPLRPSWTVCIPEALHEQQKAYTSFRSPVRTPEGLHEYQKTCANTKSPARTIEALHEQQKTCMYARRPGRTTEDLQEHQKTSTNNASPVRIPEAPHEQQKASRNIRRQKSLEQLKVFIHQHCLNAFCKKSTQN